MILLIFLLSTSKVELVWCFQLEWLQDTNIVDSSSVHNKYFNYDEYHSSKRLKLSKDVADDASTNQETKDSMIGDGFWGMESSSCDSTPNGVLEINCTEVFSSRSISWRKEK